MKQPPTVSRQPPVSLGQMLVGSRAVLLRPTVETFEAHERGSLGWALLYVAMGAVVATLLGLVDFYLKRPLLAGRYTEIGEQLARFEARTGREFPLKELFAPQAATDPIIANVLGIMVGFLVYLAVVFALGRALGGSGRFGELAYDFSLFWVPITVVSALLDLGTVSFFACFTAPLVLFVTFYGLYLTYVSIQAGMNLPGRRALLVIAVPALLYLTVVCGLLVLAYAVIAQAAR